MPTEFPKPNTGVTSAIEYYRPIYGESRAGFMVAQSIGHLGLPLDIMYRVPPRASVPLNGEKVVEGNLRFAFVDLPRRAAEVSSGNPGILSLYTQIELINYLSVIGTARWVMQSYFIDPNFGDPKKQGLGALGWIIDLMFSTTHFFYIRDLERSLPNPYTITGDFKAFCNNDELGQDFYLVKKWLEKNEDRFANSPALINDQARKNLVLMMTMPEEMWQRNLDFALDERIAEVSPLDTANGLTRANLGKYLA